MHVAASSDRQIILNAMEEYHKHTCIRFVPRRGTDIDYLYINNGNTGEDAQLLPAVPTGPSCPRLTGSWWP
jgi:hypothetical protein